MLIFHEGLPGAGKSYEACVHHIVPALKKGRKVFTNIEGLDFDKFAAVTGLNREEVEKLLIQLTDDQIAEVQQHVEKDSLVVLDELQDFFPTGRQKLGEGITRFVTRHRHEGIDIVAMGQDHRDCHSLWKRRIETLIAFTKLNAVGLEKRYSWVLSKRRANSEKFAVVNRGTKSYDPKYFGLYASHSTGTENTENYKDSRATVWASKGFRYGVPAFLVLLFFAGSYIKAFFDAEASPMIAQSRPESPAQPPPDPKQAPQPAPELIEQGGAPQSPAQRIEPLEPVPIDYFDKAVHKGRLRLGGLWWLPQDPDRWGAIIEVRDASYRILDRLDRDQLEAMGWSLTREPFGVVLEKEGVRHVAVEWPIEPFARVSESTSRSPNLKSAN